MQQWRLEMGARSVWEGEDEQSQKFEGKTEKDLKTALISVKHAFFATWLSRHTVASSSRQSTQEQNFENFSKCFSRLEGLPVRESRSEPRKSLSNPRDWTFHSRTSHQKWPPSSRLWHATWLTRDWVAKTGQHWFYEILSFWRTKHFPKTLKILKNLFVLDLTRIEHVKTHFIKYNHTNEYDIYWT